MEYRKINLYEIKFSDTVECSLLNYRNGNENKSRERLCAKTEQALLFEK